MFRAFFFIGMLVTAVSTWVALLKWVTLLSLPYSGIAAGLLFILTAFLWRVVELSYEAALDKSRPPQ